MRIRKAEPKDAKKLAQIHIDSWKVAYRGLVPDNILEKLNYDKRKIGFKEALEKELEETYIAEDKNEFFGFVTIGKCRDEDLDCSSVAELWGIYLDPKCWRRGIGSSLFSFVEDKFISRGYHEYVLWAFEGNICGDLFYRAMGHIPDGARKVLRRGKDLNVIRYKKVLTH